MLGRPPPVPPHRVWDGALTPEQCAYVAEKYLPSQADIQSVRKNPGCADEVWQLVRANLPELPEGRPTGTVTLTASRKGVAWHRDSPRHEGTHKLLIYLNEVPAGGTFFGSPKNPVLVESRIGRAVLFDLRAEHASQTFAPKYRKLALGLRLFLGK